MTDATNPSTILLETVDGQGVEVDEADLLTILAAEVALSWRNRTNNTEGNYQWIIDTLQPLKDIRRRDERDDDHFSKG